MITVYCDGDNCNKKLFQGRRPSKQLSKLEMKPGKNLCQACAAKAPVAPLVL